MTRKPKPRKMPAPTKHRNRGFQRAADTSRRAVEQIAGSKGFAEADVLMRWPEIVGEDLSTKCRPVKVSYGAKRSVAAELIVQTDSGRAPEIEHLGPVIVERVNSYYGYRAIRRLKVTQSTGLGRAVGFADDASKFQGPDAEPTQPDTKKAADMAKDIESPGLRAALTRMGANVLARERAGLGPSHTHPKKP